MKGSGESRSRVLEWTAWGIWLLTFLVICADVARRPFKHNTMPTYRLASARWWSGQDLYGDHTHSAFVYLPPAAILFTPFTWGPLLLGEILWRAATFGLFAYAIVRLHRFFLTSGDRDPGRAFLLLTLLTLPSALASLRNAQFDLPLASLLILAAAEVAAARWTAAACWLCAALALKPLAAVPLLLFGALYFGCLAPRLALGLVFVFALPFLNLNPGFVANEYVQFAHALTWASHSAEPRFSDLGALLSRLAIVPPDWLKTAARAVFALTFLGLGAAAVRRMEQIAAAWTLGALSAVYLMLFNPWTETCSYVSLGPFLASGALACWYDPRRRGLGWALAIGALGCAADAIPHMPGATVRWLKPLIALLFLPVLAWFILQARRRPSSANVSPPA